jgi:hypothetical protein
MVPSMFQLRPVFLLAMACTVGCRPQEQIARYTVPKPELVSPATGSSSPAAAAAEQEILGAVIPVGGQSWFFKLTGEPEAVERQREPFLAFVKSLTFGSDQKPSWNLPAGWNALPGSEFRFATIQMDEKSADGKPLEITVSTAGGTLLDNINRWRGQVGLPPVDDQELMRTTEKFKAGEQEGTFVRLVGKSSGGGMGGAPFAPFAGRGATLPPAAQQPQGNGGVSYDLPAGWQPAPRDAISVASFTTADGPDKVKITITSAGGDLLANINRWRGQIGLAPIGAADLASTVHKIDTLGVQADYVELIGPGEVAQSRTILGVMAAVPGQTWFVKLTGDSDIAAREKPRFEAFVKSLRIK